MQPEWEIKLEERGILEAAKGAGWEYGEVWGHPGWYYPLLQFNGQHWHLPDGRLARRWKAFDSNATPKYLWGYEDQTKDDTKKPDGCDYYWYPGASDAIAHSDGVLHLTAGEPDLLSLVSAGICNVTSFFGETSIPESFVGRLNQMGVKRVIYYPDNDATGHDAAQSLCDLLRPTGIEFTAVGLPHFVKDLNDLWKLYCPDARDFVLKLQSLKPLQLVNLHDAPKADLRGTGLTDFPDRFYDDIERALHASYKGRGGWSKPIPCVFTSHDEDDTKPAAHWHKDKKIFRCFKCQTTWLAKDVAMQLNIDYHDYIERLDSKPTPKEQQQQILQAVTVHSSDDALQRYRERLAGLHINGNSPLPFPFKALHDLQGFCRLVMPRKLIGILGLSGGGKTSFLETLTDVWRQRGYHILWWGPEWSWDQMADRAIQRYGGLSITQMMDHEVYLSEEYRTENGEVFDRFGIAADFELVEHSKLLTERIGQWPGKAFYIDQMDLTLNDLLLKAAETIQVQRDAGRLIRVAVFDYVQLLQLKGVRNDLERVNSAVTMIKAFCVDQNLVGIIASQPRKEDSSLAKDEANPELLTSEAAQFMREDQFNLMMTLNPIMEGGKMTNKAVINVVKNSAGMKDRRTVQIDLAHLRWVDKKG